MDAPYRYQRGLRLIVGDLCRILICPKRGPVSEIYMMPQEITTLGIGAKLVSDLLCSLF